MLGERRAIVGYFDTVAEEAIVRYADAHRITQGGALEVLVTESLKRKNEVPESQIASQEHKLWKALVEDGIQATNRLACQVSAKNEKLEEEIICLQSELDELKRAFEEKKNSCLSDEHIAAVTGQSEWKVKLWRHGVQKPIGKRIKQKLESYEV